MVGIFGLTAYLFVDPDEFFLLGFLVFDAQ